MEQKILVQVFVPIVNQFYDVYIPKNIMVYETTELLTQLFKKKLEKNFVENECILCDKSSGKILDINISNAEAGIINGSELMLI